MTGTSQRPVALEVEHVVVRFDGLVAIADLAFRGTAEYGDANVKAARRALALNLKRCEALVGSEDGRASAPLAGDRSPALQVASQRQRKWLDIAAGTQVEMIHLLNQLVMDWSVLTGGPVTSQPRLNSPVETVLASMTQLFDSVLRSWTAVFGAVAEGTEADAMHGNR